MVLFEFEERTIEGKSVLVHPAFEALLAEKIAKCDQAKYAGMLCALKRAEGKSGDKGS